MESEVTPVVEEEVVAVETMVVSVDVAQAITVEEEEEVVSEEEVATPCVLPCVVRVQSLNLPSGLATNCLNLCINFYYCFHFNFYCCFYFCNFL